MVSTRSRLLAARLALAASACVVAAPFVLAAGDTPTLEKLNRDKVKKGTKANVRAIGTNFGEKLEDVAVTAGGGECKVMEVKPTYISFNLPDNLPLGPAAITIRVKGTSLKSSIQIVEKIENFGDEGGEIKKPTITTKLTLVGGESPNATVEGTTEIPVGLRLECQLILKGGNGEDDCVIETKEFRLDKPQFKVSFGPFSGKTLSPGKYFALTEFHLEKANAADLKTAGWASLDTKHHAAYARLWSEDFKDWGTPDEQKKAQDELKVHYNDLTKQTTTIFENLERSYGAAGKSYFRKASGSGYDEDQWTPWLKARGLGQTEDDLKKLKNDNRFVNQGGALNEKPWRDFLENEVLKPLAEQRKGHDAFHNKYVGVKNTKMDVEGYELVSLVGKQAQTYATELYGKAKIDVPETIRNPAGIFEGHEVPSASRPEFENKRKVLLERLERALAPVAPVPGPTPSGKPK